MAIGWLFCGLGIIFCLTGVFIFHRNVYETDRKTLPAILVIIMGIILIAIGTARWVGLIS